MPSTSKQIKELMRTITHGKKMKACILVKCQPGKHGVVCDAIAKFNGVKSAFPVMGRTDVVIVADVVDLKALSSLALSIGKVTGIVASETLIGLEVS
jgi:uncharacterized protein with GYD domain